MAFRLRVCRSRRIVIIIIMHAEAGAAGAAMIVHVSGSPRSGRACMQGLALPALAKDAWQMPAFFRMIQAGMLRDPVFSVWMDPDPNAVPAGEVLFGGADPSRFTGHLHFIRVISQKCVLWSPYLRPICVKAVSCVQQIRLNSAPNLPEVHPHDLTVPHFRSAVMMTACLGPQHDVMHGLMNSGVFQHLAIACRPRLACLPMRAQLGQAE